MKMEAFRASRRPAWRLLAAVVLVLTAAPHLMGLASPPHANTVSISTQLVLNTDHEKIVKFTIRSGTPFFATVAHQQGRTEAASHPVSKPHQHAVEITVLLDHIDARQCVKELLLVGKCGGPSIEPVLKHYSLAEATELVDVSGDYSFGEPIHLFTWNQRRYSLTVNEPQLRQR